MDCQASFVDKEPWQALLFESVLEYVSLVARVDSRTQESQRGHNGLSWFRLSGPYVKQLMILILKSTQNRGVTAKCTGGRERFGRGLGWC